MCELFCEDLYLILQIFAQTISTFGCVSPLLATLYTILFCELFSDGPTRAVRLARRINPCRHGEEKRTAGTAQDRLERVGGPTGASTGKFTVLLVNFFDGAHFCPRISHCAQVSCVIQPGACSKR